MKKRIYLFQQTTMIETITSSHTYICLSGTSTILILFVLLVQLLLENSSYINLQLLYSYASLLLYLELHGNSDDQGIVR